MGRDMIADTSLRSRGTKCPSCWNEPPSNQKRAQGMPDARCTRSRLCSKKHRRQQLQVHRNNRHSLRNGFNGFLRALLGDHAWLPPSSADRSAHLTPASERQDHTPSPSASAPFVRVPVITHEPKPALRSLCTPDTAASTASRPASVTIASRPSMGRDSDRIRVIWVNRETIYYCTGDSTALCGDCPSRLGKNSNYGTGVARSVTTSSHSAMLAWNVCKTSRNARRAEARPHLQATHAFSAMYATNRSKPRMLSTRVKL